MINNNLIIVSLDSSISDSTFRHPITDDSALISQILVKPIFSLYNYYDYVNTAHCLGKEYTLVTSLVRNFYFSLKFAVAFLNLLLFSLYLFQILPTLQQLSSEFSILKPI